MMILLQVVLEHTNQHFGSGAVRIDRSCGCDLRKIAQR